MKELYSVHPEDFKLYGTELIRSRFHIEAVMQADKVQLTYTHYDRMVVGGAMPISQTLTLETFPILRSDYFLERRELGIINVGGEAVVTVDEQSFTLQKLDCLYVGKGSINIKLKSTSGSSPAQLYFLSAPAHTSYPTQLCMKEEAESAEMGNLSTSNKRTIYRYIHKNGIQSCQLVMGLTILATGSVWNTMPPHTHNRRMEVYFYFDVAEGQTIFHYMGEPNETRHIVLQNHQAVVSPPWSIHAGSGTSNYGFIWGMAGENLEYADMDGLAITQLK